MARNSHILFVIFLILTSLCFSSCENDPHDPDIELFGNVEKYFPSYCVNLTVSYNMGNKYFHMNAEPHFYFDPAEWGLTVEKVEYYVDDSYVKTETKNPFSIEYESRDWYVGAHNIRADITISGKNIETFVLQTSKVIDNSSAQENAADIWFDYNFATTGEEFFISGNINCKRSATGTTIKSLSAKWDETSMGEKTSTPFKLTRIVTENVGTNHAVYATLKYMQGSTEHNYSFSIPSYEIPGQNSVMQTFRLKSRFSDYQNGDILEGIARQFIGSEVKATYGFELYFDDNLIGSSKTFPFELSYKLENLTLGEHTLKKQWVRYDEAGNKTNSFSTDETITITK